MVVVPAAAAAAAAVVIAAWACFLVKNTVQQDAVHAVVILVPEEHDRSQWDRTEKAKLAEVWSSDCHRMLVLSLLLQIVNLSNFDRLVVVVVAAKVELVVVAAADVAC